MKTIVITGANTGIGFATAKKFVEDGHHVILACRNLSKAEHARNELLQINKGKIDIVQLDLNSLEQVSATAEQLIKNYPKIDILINNAGIASTQLEQTEDGFEKQIGVNYLAHVLWTIKLLPVVQKSEDGRIIHLASLMHWVGTVDIEQFQVGNIKKYNGIKFYGNSKLANLLFSNALAEKLKGTSTTSNALHPGGVDSEIYRDLPRYQYLAIKLFLISPTKPAQLIKEMALDPSWSKKNGEYASLQTPAFKSKQAKDLKMALKLYDSTIDLIKTYL